jgi:hypothetical protein
MYEYEKECDLYQVLNSISEIVSYFAERKHCRNADKQVLETMKKITDLTEIYRPETDIPFA